MLLSKQFTPIHAVAKALVGLAEHLIGIYCFTGSDTISRIHYTSKLKTLQIISEEQDLGNCRSWYLIEIN